LSDTVFEFGEFRLDPRQRRCIRRADGQPVPLKARSFDTLLYLVRHAGALVEKSALLQALWPGTVVEENSLNKQISAIRRALGDDGDAYIVTVPGRGYQFVMPVTLAGSTQASTHTPSSAPSPASVAVLPFANVTGDPGNDYLGLGLAEELLNVLARVPRLEVPARTSSFVYHGRNVDVRDIARDLNVTTVLEGSVRIAGDRVRVTAQLVDGRTGYQLWSQAFDRKADDFFELQDELARAIVQALRLEFDRSLPVIPRMLLPPTRDLEAYRLYLEGAALTAPGTLPDHERSQALMREAIERDPVFAHAHMGLALTQATGIYLGLLPLSFLESAENAARRALELDEELAYAHAASAMVCAMRGKFVDAERGFQRARVLDSRNPHLVHCHLFFVHEPVGRIALAYEESLWTHRRAPAWIPAAVHLAAVALIADRDPQEIRRQIEIAVGLGFARTRPPIPELLAQLAIRAGDTANLGDSLGMEPATAETVRDQREALRHTLRARAEPAYRHAALEALDEQQRRLSARNPGQSSWIQLIMSYTQLGDLTRAFDCATCALDLAARWNSIGALWGMLWMPEMEPFRADERFAALAERLGLAQFWQTCGPPDAGLITPVSKRSRSGQP